MHFLPDDPPELIGRKLLRVNLSDLAAKGAAPLGYLMTLSAPRDTPEAWFAGFAAGLAADQARVRCDAARRRHDIDPGPDLAVAHHPRARRAGAALRRAAARGRAIRIWVSGTIGDGALGLARGAGPASATRPAICWTATGLPRPRLGLGRSAGVASAGDGYFRRAGRRTSGICAGPAGVAAVIEAAPVPLSAGGARGGRPGLARDCA